MRPTLRIQAAAPAALASRPARAVDPTGLVEARARTVRALEQTRGARTSGQLERAGEGAADELEKGLTAAPEPGRPGVVTARVVAAADRRAKLPAVPLSGLIVRLKVRKETVGEQESNRAGLADLELPKDKEGSYELEVIGPDCTVLACQRGRWSAKAPSPAHRVEVARTELLKPHLERARPWEESIRTARERAALTRRVAAAALEAQEKRLVAYLAEIDAALACRPGTVGKELPEPGP